MIPTSYEGTDVYLWIFPPDWRTRFTLRARLPAKEATGNSNIGSRRPDAPELLWETSFEASIFDDDARLFRLAELNRGDEPVLMPVWPFARLVSEALLPTLFDECLCVTYEPDWTSFELHLLTDAAPGGFSAEAMIAPVLWGYFQRRLRPIATTDEGFRLRPVSFVEGGGDPGLAMKLAAVTTATGPATESGEKPFWNFDVHFDEPDVGAADVVIERRARNRSLSEIYFPQVPARVAGFTFWFDGHAEWAEQAGFFRQSGGKGAAFWLPNRLTETPLSADASGSSFSVDDPDMLDRGRAICLSDGIGVAEALKITNVGAIANPITVTPALSRTFEAARTVVASLMLVRFREEILEWHFTTDDKGEVNASFVEVPTEYQAQAGETEGTTHGRLAPEALGFEIRVTEAGATTTFYFTDWPEDVDYGGNTYVRSGVHGFDLERISYSIGGENDRAEIMLRIPDEEGSVFRRFVPWEIDGTVEIVVRELHP